MLYACPVCSVIHPDNRMSVVGAVVIRGRRSGRFMLVRQLGCKHEVPVLTSADTEAAIVEQWNGWAEQKAGELADDRGWPAERTAWFRYGLGMGGHPEISSKS